MACIKRDTGATPPEWIWVSVKVPHLLGRAGGEMDMWLHEHGAGEWKRPTMAEFEALGRFDGPGRGFLWAFSDPHTAMAFKLQFG